MFRTAIVLSAGLLLLTVTVAEGQQRGRQRGRGLFGGSGAIGSLALLISLEEVRQELSATPEQEKLLDALQEDLRNQRRTLFRGGRGPNRGGDGGRIESLLKRMETLNEQGDALVLTILEPEQAKRLKQLRLQRDGAAAFDRPEFIKTLNLTETQIAKIREIRDDARRNRQGNLFFRGNDGDRAEDLEKMEREITELLTDEQKEQWAALKGEPFEFPETLSRSGRRGSRDDDDKQRERPDSDR